MTRLKHPAGTPIDPDICRRDENTRLRKLGADLSLDKEALESVIRKRLELVALKAAIGPMQHDYAFSERRACALVLMAVSSYRYQTSRTDEPLRTRHSGMDNRLPFALLHLGIPSTTRAAPKQGNPVYNPQNGNPG